jgi:hypothetical protein
MYTQCGYPNCGTPLARCDIHHVAWWSRGGPTDLSNLVPLCKSHHLFVHELGYTISTGRDRLGNPLSGPQRWSFSTPRGVPIADHRTTQDRYLDKLTLAMATPPTSRLAILSASAVAAMDPVQLSADLLSTGGRGNWGGHDRSRTAAVRSGRAARAHG